MDAPLTNRLAHITTDEIDVARIAFPVSPYMAPKNVYLRYRGDTIRNDLPEDMRSRIEVRSTMNWRAWATLVG